MLHHDTAVPQHAAGVQETQSRHAARHRLQAGGQDRPLPADRGEVPAHPRARAGAPRVLGLPQGRARHPHVLEPQPPRQLRHRARVPELPLLPGHAAARAGCCQRGPASR